MHYQHTLFACLPASLPLLPPCLPCMHTHRSSPLHCWCIPNTASALQDFPVHACLYLPAFVHFWCCSLQHTPHCGCMPAHHHKHCTPPVFCLPAHCVLRTLHTVLEPFYAHYCSGHISFHLFLPRSYHSILCCTACSYHHSGTVLPPTLPASTTMCAFCTRLSLCTATTCTSLCHFTTLQRIPPETAATILTTCAWTLRISRLPPRTSWDGTCCHPAAARRFLTAALYGFTVLVYLPVVPASSPFTDSPPAVCACLAITRRCISSTAIPP